MVNVRVKICGITNLTDAMAAIDAGADALGFVFHAASPRNINPAAVAAIVRSMPPFVSKVGLFVDAPESEIRQTAETCGLDTIQLHGEEPPEACRPPIPGLKVIKAFRVRDAKSLDVLPRYETDAWLLDSFVPGVQGGTGQTFNWSIAMEARLLGRPIVLSGGLTPENVVEAVRKVRPYAVDASSGLESNPGKKDSARMAAFVRLAKGLGL